MKVNDPNAAGLGATGLGKANLDKTIAVDRARTGTVTVNGAPETPEDHVQLSVMGARIRELAADTPERAVLVDRLAAQVAGGNYKADVADTVRGLLREASKPGS